MLLQTEEVEKDSEPSQESRAYEEDVSGEEIVRSMKSSDATWHGSSEEDVGISNIGTSDHSGGGGPQTNAAPDTVNINGEGNSIKSETKIVRKLERKNSLYQQLAKERNEQLGNERVKSLMVQNKDRENLCRLNIVYTRKGSTRILQGEPDEVVNEKVIESIIKEDRQNDLNENKNEIKEKNEKAEGIEDNERKENKVESTPKYLDIHGEEQKEKMMIRTSRKSIDRKYSGKQNTRTTTYLLERADSIRLGSRSSKQRQNSDLESIISDLTEDEENERDIVKKIEMKFIEIGKRIIEVHNRQNSLNDTCKREYLEIERRMKLINDKKMLTIGKNSCHKDSANNRKTRNFGFSFRAAAPVDEIQLLKNITEIKIKEENILIMNIDVEKRSRLKTYVEDEKIRQKEFDNQIRKVNEKGADQVKDLGIRLDLCRKRAEEKNRKNRSDIERLLRGLGHLTATLEKQRKTKEDKDKDNTNTNTDCGCEADSSKRYSSSIEVSSNRGKSHRFSKAIDTENIFFHKRTDSHIRNSELQLQLQHDDALQPQQDKSQSIEMLLGTQTNEKTKLSIFKKSVYDFFTRKEIPFFYWLK